MFHSLQSIKLFSMPGIKSQCTILFLAHVPTEIVCKMSPEDLTIRQEKKKNF